MSLISTKFSFKSQSGGRLKDLYEVWGRLKEVFIGGDEEMNTILNMVTSGYCDLEYNIYGATRYIQKSNKGRF